MRKSMLAVVATAVCLGVAGWAGAQEKPNAEGPRRDGPPAILRPNVLAEELALTDAQKQQVEEILRQAKVNAEAAGEPQAKRQAWQSAMEQIRSNVLNDRQRAKFAQLRQERGGRPGGGQTPFMAALKQLDLTQEQQTQVRQIMQQSKADMEKAADPQAKRQAHQASINKIRTEVLSDQQRQQLDKIVAEQPKRGDGPAGRPHKGAGKSERQRGKHAPASRPA